MLTISSIREVKHKYPYEPGAKVGGTSQAAAESMKEADVTLRARVYKSLKVFVI